MIWMCRQDEKLRKFLTVSKEIYWNHKIIGKLCEDSLSECTLRLEADINASTSRSQETPAPLPFLDQKHLKNQDRYKTPWKLSEAFPFLETCPKTPEMTHSTRKNEKIKPSQR
jgi:hypothetical protein